MTRRSSHDRRALAWFVSMACAACGAKPFSPTLRSGEVLENAAGRPTTPCEAERWVEAVPSTANQRTSTVEGSGQFRHTVTTYQSQNGIAIYRAGAAEREGPIDLRSFLEPLRMSGLMRAQFALEEENDRAYSRMNRIRLGGDLAILGGALMIGGGVLLNSEQKEVAGALALTGVAGVLGGVITTLVSLFFQPSVIDNQAVAIRRRVFVPDEVPADGVSQAVTLHNSLVRASCSERGAASPEGVVP